MISAFAKTVGRNTANRLRRIESLKLVQRLSVQQFSSNQDNFFSFYEENYSRPNDRNTQTSVQEDVPHWLEPDGGDSYLPQIGDIEFLDSFEKTPEGKNMYHLGEGENVNVDPEKIRAAFPEGVAGEWNAECEMMLRYHWMMRDGGKLLCNLLDEYKAQKTGTPLQPMEKILQTVPKLEGLTDRPEWSSAEMKVYYHGFELTETSESNSPKITKLKKKEGKKVAKSRMTDHGQKIVCGEGSVVYDCVEKLKKIVPEGKIPQKILVGGDRGVGKSICINQMIMHARENDWLTLFIPDGWRHVRDGMYVEPVFHNGKLLYNNRSLSLEMLRGFWAAHNDKLGAIGLRNPEKFKRNMPVIEKFHETYLQTKNMPGYANAHFLKMRDMVTNEELPEAEVQEDAGILYDFNYERWYSMGCPVHTLEHLILAGIAFHDISGNCAMDLIDELQQLDIPEWPVLICVDEYNCWEGMNTAFAYNQRDLEGKDILIPNLLQYVSEKKAEKTEMVLANGVFVGGLSQRYNEGKKHTYEGVRASVPLFIQVPHFSSVEFLSQMSKYADHGFYPKYADVSQICAYRTHTASNARNIRKRLIGFFMPLFSTAGKDDDYTDDIIVGEVKQAAKGFGDRDWPKDFKYLRSGREEVGGNRRRRGVEVKADEDEYNLILDEKKKWEEAVYAMDDDEDDDDSSDDDSSDDDSDSSDDSDNEETDGGTDGGDEGDEPDKK